MLHSIRTRMFINVLTLLAPLCFFAWMLMGEVDKQIIFAQQESKGLLLQEPLTEMLQKLHQRQIQAASKTDTTELDAAIAKLKSAVDETYGAHGADIGFNEAKWTDLKTALDAALARADGQADAIAAAKAMIARSSDGSNLTLDPDLDSYYAMDVGSFAIPAAIDNLGNVQAEFLKEIKIDRIDTIKYMLGNDASRILGNLGITLKEDPNFYGSSETLSRLTPLMADYEAKQNALVAMLDKLHADTSSVSSDAVAEHFAAVNHAMGALRQAVPEEMAILLGKRIADFSAHKQTLLLQGGIAVLVGFVLFLLIAQSIVTPINRLRDVMRELADGRIDIKIPYLKKRDEVGQMAKAVVVFQDNAKIIRDMAKEFESSVQHVVDIVASAATELDAASKSLTHQATDSHKRLQHLNGDIGDASTNMATISSSSEQLAASIGEISSQVQKATTTTNQAVSEAENVKNVAVGLSEAAQKVNGIVNLINSIASQINLLALNATIEAARAGDAGKGFAVVASEVKSLANQTSSATAEIGQLVTAIQDSSSQTLRAVEQITEVITQINHISGSIAAAVEEQGMATKDIAGHIKQATDRMGSVTSNAKSITESAAQSAAAAAQTLQASGDLSKQSETLRGDVGKFLRKLIAA